MRFRRRHRSRIGDGIRGYSNPISDGIAPPPRRLRDLRRPRRAGAPELGWRGATDALVMPGAPRAEGAAEEVGLVGYFSNGSHGAEYERRVCGTCAHHDPEEACAIWAAHLCFQGDGKGVAAVLDTLIPRERDGENAKCAMWIERPGQTPWD